MNTKSSGKIYYSFDEIGQELFGLKPQNRVTKDNQKLESQRKKFLGTCPYCKEPLHYSYGTNIVSCTNENCKGKVITFEDGTEIYKPYYRILSDKGSLIGSVIFDEKEKL